MARVYFVNGRIYHETGERKAVVNGRVVEETTAAGGFSITDIDLDDTVYDGQTAVIHGSGFGTVQGQVFIGDEQQTVTGWADTAININVVRGGLSLGAQTLEVLKPT